TLYVLSAYLWNMGDAANHVTTVIDMNDVSQEPQVTLNSSDANADAGYFVYRSFNTTDTGAIVTLRAFYDGLAGGGASAAYFPIAAQWDNLAITKAADFVPPQPSGSGANVRPQVSIYAPCDGTNIFFAAAPAALEIAASASDLDGTIAKVEFYAGPNRLGEVTSNPYVFTWSNFLSGAYQLTALATDNQGATTVSAPVAITISAPAEPVALRIAQLGTAFLLSWPASATAFSLE